jgi:TolB-like protein
LIKHYLLTGRYTVIADRLAVNAELCLASSGEILWAERLVCPVAEMLEPHSEMLERISQQAHRAILDREAERAVRQPLPSLEAFTLL